MSILSRSVAAIASGLFAAAACAAPDRPADSMPVPGAPLTSFDIGFAAGGVYAFADRSNASVDLFSTRTHRFIGRLGGFSGAADADASGPNGVAMLDGGKTLWAGDGKSTLKIFDVASRRPVASVSTGGTGRVDELGYDPRDHLVIAANNADDPPFVTFVSARPPYAVKARLTLKAATDGIEQPLWDASTGEVFLAIPALNGNKADGGIAVIDPGRGVVKTIVHVARCMPAGLAAGPDGQILIGCSSDAVEAGFPARSLLLDARSRKIAAAFDQVGGSDEVWYDAASGQYGLAAVANPGGAVIGFIDARRKAWLGNAPSGQSAHSVASAGGEFLVPVAAGNKDCPAGCVKIFRR